MHSVAVGLASNDAGRSRRRTDYSIRIRVCRCAQSRALFSYELPLAVTVAQLHAKVRFPTGKIVGVGEYRGLVLHGMHRAADVLREVLLQGVENPLEVLLVEKLNMDDPTPENRADKSSILWPATRFGK